MFEVLRSLPQNALVLDLGCADGSFPAAATDATVIGFDLDPPARLTPTLLIQGDAARLPFSDSAFSAVISNHSLEHFEDLDACLHEIGRVLRPDGTLFVSVPDASTLTDKLYRWLSRGGGHINAFTSSAGLALRIEAATGLRHLRTRLLCSSLSFLNRRNARHRVPRRAIVVGAGYEPALFLFVLLSRLADRYLRTRLSVYGWALYFGEYSGASIDSAVWWNVCIRCGAGHAASFLTAHSRTRKVLGLRVYVCPSCGAINPLISDHS